MIPSNWPEFSAAILAYAGDPDECLSPEECASLGAAVAMPSGPVVACVQAYEILKPHHAALGLTGAQLLAGCADIIYGGNFHGKGPEAVATVKPQALARIAALEAA